jgi:hypothetical protein
MWQTVTRITARNQSEAFQRAQHTINNLRRHRQHAGETYALRRWREGDALVIQRRL